MNGRASKGEGAGGVAAISERVESSLEVGL
jgi:hypothetical protein